MQALGIGDEETYKTSVLPLDLQSITGLVIIGGLMFLATLGGIGGTSALFTILIVFFNFKVHIAVAHLNVFDFIGSFGRLVYDISRGWKNPEKNLINYHIVLITTPFLLLGSFLGVSINEVAPRVFIGIGIFLLLCLVAIMSFIKYLSKLSEEKAKYQKLAQVMEVKSDISGSLLLSQTGTFTSKVQNELDTDLAEPHDSNINVETPSHIQMKMNVADKLTLALYCIITPIVKLARGTQTIASVFGATTCSISDMAICSCYLLFLIIIGAVTTLRLYKRGKHIQNSKSEFRINFSNLLKLQIGTFTIGFLGSSLGIARSLMFNIYLVYMGMGPFVASPTSLLLTAITASSSSMLYIADQLVYLDAVLIIGGLILIFTVGTRITIYEIIMRRGKESVPMLFIVIAIILAIPGVIYKLVPPILEDYKAGVDIWKIGDFCPK